MLPVANENKTLHRVILKLGHNINTDVLHPSEYFSLNHDTVKSGFLRGMQHTNGNAEDYLIVAGKNFGCGSSRETTAYSFKLNGVKAIIAISFSRIFFRNIVNNGIIPITLPELYDVASDKEPIKLDFNKGTVLLVQQKISFKIPPFDKYITRVMESNGLLNLLDDFLKNNSSTENHS